MGDSVIIYFSKGGVTLKKSRFFAGLTYEENDPEPGNNTVSPDVNVLDSQNFAMNFKANIQGTFVSSTP